ncbi:VCBS repeat-containing protein [Galbibacter sp. BG1]|uniref:VCBS repeat-containing protein n=1 Tax=Galbibacter sp. BG1 TaxID=1170699 RepID=UPI0015BF58EF|nr:VCBS repeat-containing protein [Galbibacter sp. BG1]QLE01739.1 VCBS repeat-containing protein [Galbibacter sp. BG1]
MSLRHISIFGNILFILFACTKEKEPALISNDDYLFNSIPSEISGVDFVNEIKESSNQSIINYIYYYNGGGVAAGDINNDGLQDLYFVSNQGKNRLYLNKGEMKFEDITDKAMVQSNSDWNTGVTMVDINNDGYLDIYLCSVSGLLDFKGHNELFINNGDGTFSEKSAEYGLNHKGYSTQAYFFDYDKDDDLDVYIVNHAIHTTLSHGKADIRNKRVSKVGDVLLKNESGKYKDVSEEAKIYGGLNGYGLSASISDFNNDGWDDIYVCNDFHEDDYYYLNKGDGTFVESLNKSFSTISRFSMGSDAADINNDGFIDLITLDMLPKDEKVKKESEGDDAMYNMQNYLSDLGYKDQYARNMLQINSGNGSFVETALFNNLAATDWSWGPLFADFDNDGHQDLFISNGILRRPNDLDFKNYVSNAFKNRSHSRGIEWLYNSIDKMPSGAVSNEIFKGNSSKFDRKTGKWFEEKASLSNGALYCDLDNDGDLDIVLNNLNSASEILENKSESTSNKYINLSFEYTKGNFSGIGVKAVIYSGNLIQKKQLFRSRGFLSSKDNRLHFGLGNNQYIDSIKIIWPDNSLQKIGRTAVNQNLLVTFKDTLSKYKFVNKPFEKPFRKDNDFITFMHEEDKYDDFHNEKLIPYAVSRLGPAVATGDIDGNGFVDLFLGNSSGHTAKLYMNSGSSFNLKGIPGIESDSLYEDNAAEFFDADGDGDLDLYIASGISSRSKNGTYGDRFYLNNKGNFSKTQNRIPDNNFNARVVSAIDYDKDGDIDLFIGNYSKEGDFGQEVFSLLLQNDGKGKFIQNTNFELRTHVTDAIWEDLDNNGYPDLIVSSEWDSPKIFYNNKGKLTASDDLKINGLWQTLLLFDIDLDGDKDIILGNWGLNTHFHASTEKPLRMYYSDFNNDGYKETIIAYNVDDKYYPINSKMELESQINFIKKKYTTNKLFSSQTIEEIFGSKEIKKSKIFEISTLSSGYLVNENGNFTNFIPLSNELQMAPITAFEKIDYDDEQYLLITGNKLGVNTYHGGYSSLKGFFLKNSDEIIKASDLGILSIDSEVVATKIIQCENEDKLFIISNNSPLEVYTIKN